MTFEGLPLKRGDAGASVRDLHRRLIEAGFSTVNPLVDVFDAQTEDAVRRFQTSRRIEVDGVVGRHTWVALAEAAHHLGDRLLYHKSSPMLRGDDVAELQQRLGALGFDAGRVDGIFGPDTARALESFQRNAGLPTDAILGPDSYAALCRLGGREALENVATVREREHLRAGGSERPATTRFVIGELGGLGAVADTCARHLRHHHVRVDVVTHPDESHHAQVSNRLEVDGYLGVLAGEQDRCTVSYFATTGFESPGGRRLAELLVNELAIRDFVNAAALGQRIPVLRETRMPAVVVRIGPPSRLVEAAPEVAAAISSAIEAWTAAPAGQVDAGDA